LVSLSLGGLSILTSLISGLLVFAYGIVTLRFLRMLYRFNKVGITPWIRLPLILAVIAPVSYFGLRQFSPIRILRSQSSQSIFDEAWESADQLAYGYPSPFLRFLDVPDQIHGKMIIDWTSLLMIIWIMLLFVFFLLSIICISLKLITKSGEPGSGGNSAALRASP